MIDDLKAQVTTYLMNYPADLTETMPLLKQLEANEDLTSRKNMNGHIVASVALLNPAQTHVLVVDHKTYNFPVFPGGHQEPGETPYETALREVAEEVGITNAVIMGDEPYLLQIDTHAIPARPEKDEGKHWHHDFVFLLTVKDLPTINEQEEEIENARWVAVEDLAGEHDHLKIAGDRIMKHLKK